MPAVAAAPSRVRAFIRRVCKFQRKQSGFTRLYNVALNELGRITSGKTEVMCVLRALQEYEYARYYHRDPRPISAEDFADLAGDDVDVSGVRKALKDLCDRGVLKRKESCSRGKHVYSVPYKDWQKLPTFVVPKKTIQSSEALDSADDTENSELEANGKIIPQEMEADDEPVRLSERLSEGRFSRRHEFPRSANSFRVKSERGPLEYRAVFRNDCLDVIIEPGQARETLAPPREAALSPPAPIANGKGAPFDDFGRENIRTALRFAVFQEAATRAGLPASSYQWSEAEKLWRDLSTEDCIAAVQGIDERITAGEFAEAAFRPRPNSYLKKRIWELPVRPQKISAQAARDRGSEELLRAARELDRKLEQRR